MSFSYGWIDGLAFQVLKTYPSMVTGNLIQIGRSIEKIALQRFYRSSYSYWKDILVRNLLVEIACGFLGPLICCYIKKRVRNREDSFAIICNLYFISFLLMISTIYSSRQEFEDEIDQYGEVDDTVISQKILSDKGHTWNTLSVFLMALSSGMMIFWSTKILYTTNLLTLNWMRFSEHIYKGLFNIHQGGAKMRGDMLIVIVISIAFALGAIFGILSTDDVHNLRQYLLSLGFACVLYPLHMIYGYYIPHQERLQLAKKEKMDKMKNEISVQTNQMINNPLNKT